MNLQEPIKMVGEEMPALTPDLPLQPGRTRPEMPGQESEPREMPSRHGRPGMDEPEMPQPPGREFPEPATTPGQRPDMPDRPSAASPILS